MEALMSSVLTGTGIILLILSAVVVAVQGRGPVDREPESVAALEPPACPRCHRRALRIDAQFCARCGSDLSGGAEPESVV